jgi:hypothetical protein
MKRTLKSAKKIGFPSFAAIEDAWQREAARAAVEQARAVVTGGVLPPMTPIGRLSDVEWGWIVAAVLFGWISTRATQAASNGAGIGADAYICNVAIEPDPWLAGAVAAILPELAKPEIDWKKFLVEFSREEMIAFLVDAHTLITKAIVCRDKGESLVTCRGPDGTGVAKPGDVDDGKPWDDPLPF